MASIHELAQNGTLTKPELRQRKKSRPGIVNEPDANGVPPLTLAAARGHLDVVKLLIREKADVRHRDRKGYTALDAAARHARTNQAAIILALLDAKAEVDAPCPALRGNTPLMTVVSQTADLDAIAQLRGHGASLERKNDDGQTAVDLARGRADVVEALKRKPEEKRTLFRVVVGKIIAVVTRVLVLVNKPLKKGYQLLTQGFGYTPPDRRRKVKNAPHPSQGQNRPPEDRDQPTQNAPRIVEPVPETPEEKKEREIKEQLHEIAANVKKSGLSKFTGMDDTFLETLADKAIALRNNANTDLGNPENIPDMIDLAMYKPVIYCDDSGSMAGGRYELQKNIVKRISRVTTMLVPDNLGVDLTFINNNQHFTNLREDEINDTVNKVSPGGGTTIGSSLETKILEPLVYEPLKDGGPGLKRPVLISIITDGEPTDDPKNRFQKAIMKCKRRLDEKHYPHFAVLFQISQVGNEADDFLNDLKNDPELQDSIYVTSGRLDDAYKQERENERALEVWLLKTLVKPIYAWGPDNMRKAAAERKAAAQRRQELSG
ncbi:hypothetical protein B0I37DRAFT_61545 [Chaetomium sp. MPI-CAGE-AT-0009]|nr:hypothetical protein B0I37DRAFT_61545 [Chaetomium sp. MPI-CAGE-AT-0009]